MFNVYGGSDWVNFLLALGGDGINEDLVKCYNAEIDRRTPGGAHGREAAIGRVCHGRDPGFVEVGRHERRESGARGAPQNAVERKKNV